MSFAFHFVITVATKPAMSPIIKNMNITHSYSSSFTFILIHFWTNLKHFKKYIYIFSPVQSKNMWKLSEMRPKEFVQTPYINSTKANVRLRTRKPSKFLDKSGELSKKKSVVLSSLLYFEQFREGFKKSGTSQIWSNPATHPCNKNKILCF